jgi:hypothetical protein
VSPDLTVYTCPSAKQTGEAIINMTAKSSAVFLKIFIKLIEKCSFSAPFDRFYTNILCKI